MPSQEQGWTTLIITIPSSKRGEQVDTEVTAYDGGYYFAHRVGGIFESPIFAAP